MLCIIVGVVIAVLAIGFWNGPPGIITAVAALGVVSSGLLESVRFAP